LDVSLPKLEACPSLLREQLFFAPLR
jgi:hypothetical protein